MKITNSLSSSTKLKRLTLPQLTLNNNLLWKISRSGFVHSLEFPKEAKGISTNRKWTGRSRRPLRAGSKTRGSSHDTLLHHFLARYWHPCVIILIDAFPQIEAGLPQTALKSISTEIEHISQRISQPNCSCGVQLEGGGDLRQCLAHWDAKHRYCHYRLRGIEGTSCRFTEGRAWVMQLTFIFDPLLETLSRE